MGNSYTHYTGELTPSDLDLVVSAMKPACDKWYEIGLALNLERIDRCRIEWENMFNPDTGLRTVISLWLKRVSPPLTWSSIVVALRQPEFGLRWLASLIEEEHVLEKKMAEGKSNYHFL